ncbi:hypothetical protein V6N12_022965 [Hibiscus sabdariffa]|uniref:Uncharacterized protein n=1 Tax=Hibiscus sabdariffa TaxID=183260 RepID=A0ABR2FWF2_9ROSI
MIPDAAQPINGHSPLEVYKAVEKFAAELRLCYGGETVSEDVGFFLNNYENLEGIATTDGAIVICGSQFQFQKTCSTSYLLSGFGGSVFNFRVS